MLTTLLVAATPALALDPHRTVTQYSRTVWQTEQGLPQNTVRAITQTADGYLWFGTQSGLVRFDGVRFTVFDRGNTPALENHHVHALAVDREDALWVGTNGGGLVRYRNGVFRRWDERDGLGSGRVMTIEPDGSGLWVGTYGGGLARLEDERVVATLGVDDGLSHEVVLALETDARGGLWIGTFGGGLDHRAGDGTVTSYDVEDGLADGVVWALQTTASGELWIGTNRGLARLRDGVFDVYRQGDGLAHDGVLSLLEDRDGNLWVGTYGGGLQRLYDGRFSPPLPRAGTVGDTVWSLFEDLEGSLWVGRVGGGLMQLADGAFVTWGVEEGLPSNLINTVVGDDDGTLWLGTRNRGLVRFGVGGIETFTAGDGSGLPHDGIWALLLGGDGALWLGTNGGGLARRGADGRITVYGVADGLPATKVFCLAEDDEGALWAGTNRGLARLLDDRFTVYDVADGLAGNAVRTLHVDRRGDLWIGTTTGLSRRRGERFESFTVADGLASNQVWTIHEDAGGALWLSTLGGGLTRFRDDRFETFTSRDGLYDDDVQSIAEDHEGNLWLGSGRGIFRLDRAELEAFVGGDLTRLRQLPFGRRDGLARAECDGGEPAVWRAPDGRLWFATVGGVATVDPARVVIPPAPAVLFETFEVDGEARVIDAEPTLPPGSRTIVVRFTAPTLRAADRVRFRYRLHGFDDDWVHGDGQRLARYTNLGPGGYRFTVMASDEAGRWIGEPASFAFRVAPPWYRGGLFLTLATLVFAAAVYGLHHLRVGRLRRRERELERRVEDAVAHLKVLRGMLPICAECRKVRAEDGAWSTIESFLDRHSEVSVSHGLCPQCAVRMMRDSDELDTAIVRAVVENAGSQHRGA